MGLKRRGEHPPYRYPPSKPTTVDEVLMDKIEQTTPRSGHDTAAAWTAQCPWVVECHEHGFIDGAFQSMYLAGKRRDQHLADEHGVAIALHYKPVAKVADGG